MKRIGLAGAAAIILLLSGNAVAALPQQDQNEKHDKQHGKEKKQKTEGNAKEDQGKPQQVQQEQVQQQLAQQQQAQRLQAQQQQAQQQQAEQQALQAAQQQKVQQNAQQFSQQRIAQQQQRTAQYQQNIAEQLRLAQAHNAELEQQNRRSQAQIQQQYAQNLQQQQLQAQNDHNRDYGRDPYFNTRFNYRYKRGTEYRQTNRYGADVLRQAVNYGYQQGIRAGDADRLDHWGYKYQNAFAYRDANYGYTGRYVDQSDYNYYFRQGFRKGYDDGYYRRARYGRQSGGSYTVLRVVLSGILKLEVIR